MLYPSQPFDALDVDDLPSGVIVLDHDGQIASINAAMRAMLGHVDAASIGQPLSSVLTRPSAILYQAVVSQQLRAAGRVPEACLDFRGADTANVPTLCSIALREHGLQTVTILCATPMSDRRRVEEDLLRSRRAAENIPGVVYQYLLGVDGMQSIPYASESLRPLFGVGPTELQASAEALFKAVHPDDVAAFSASIAASAETLMPWRFKFRVKVQNDGYRWMEGHSTPERLEDGSTLWHGYLQDITDRKVIEDALQDKQDADRANRAKSEFLARVSHELRTPLNAILGFAQLLSLDKGNPLPTLQRNRVRHIEDAGHDLLSLIDEVLDITSIEAGAVNLEPTWLNVKSLLTRVGRLVEASARERDIVVRLIAHSTISVCADPSRLAQILTNLLSNAVKYSRAGSTVTVTCVVAARQLTMTVEDAGLGMTEGQVEHLFEPFNRLGAERTSVQGSGLGLVIVKQLVDAMSGTISVTSDPARGSVFTVVLPQQAHVDGGSAEPSVDLPLPLPEQPAPRRARVLYVEDNPVNAMIMEAICELQEGLALHVEGTGSAAIEWVRKHHVDLLLLDMNLPDIDGIALLAELRQVCGRPDIEAIAVSADAMPGDLKRARLAGFSDYWTKPLDVNATLEKLASALGLPRAEHLGAQTLSA